MAVAPEEEGFPPMEILATVPTTMDAARERIASGRHAFGAQGRLRYAGVMTGDQTAGRGQRGRDWYGVSGAALAATYYFRHGPTDPQRAGEISLLAGVAVARTLQGVIAEASPQGKACEGAMQSLSAGAILPVTGLKWPNDVLLNRRKVGGILVEMMQAPDRDWIALVGVGINLAIADFPPEIAATATSLAREGIGFSDWQTLGRRIALALHDCAVEREEHGFSRILTHWRGLDQTGGQAFLVEQEGSSCRCTAVGVDDAGRLLVRAESGLVFSVLSATSLKPL